MSIAIEQLQKIAKLSKIHIEQNSSAEILKDMNCIFSFIQQIDDVDTKDVKPLVSVFEQTLLMREDKVTDGDCAEQIVQNTSHKYENFFLVPKVVE